MGIVINNGNTYTATKVIHNGNEFSLGQQGVPQEDYDELLADYNELSSEYAMAQSFAGYICQKYSSNAISCSGPSNWNNVFAGDGFIWSDYYYSSNYISVYDLSGNVVTGLQNYYKYFKNPYTDKGYICYQYNNTKSAVYDALSVKANPSSSANWKVYANNGAVGGYVTRTTAFADCILSRDNNNRTYIAKVNEDHSYTYIKTYAGIISMIYKLGDKYSGIIYNRTSNATEYIPDILAETPQYITVTDTNTKKIISNNTGLYFSCPPESTLMAGINTNITGSYEYGQRACVCGTTNFKALSKNYITDTSGNKVCFNSFTYDTNGQLYGYAPNDGYVYKIRSVVDYLSR